MISKTNLYSSLFVFYMVGSIIVFVIKIIYKTNISKFVAFRNFSNISFILFKKTI